jgi:hypothetical protein
MGSLGLSLSLGGGSLWRSEKRLRVLGGGGKIRGANQDQRVLILILMASLGHGSTTAYHHNIRATRVSAIPAQLPTPGLGEVKSV